MEQLQLVLPIEGDGHALLATNEDRHISDGVVVAGCQSPCPKHPGRPDSGTCRWGHVLQVHLQQVPGSVDLQQVPGYVAVAAEDLWHDLKQKETKASSQ